jgi:threonine aldolase
MTMTEVERPAPLAAGAAPEDYAFATDAASTVHPDVMAAIAAVNRDPAAPYGVDPYSRAVSVRMSEMLWSAYGRTAFVFNGTAANVLSVRALCKPWEGVICAQEAQLNTLAGGALEAVGGLKVIPVASTDGKLTATSIQGVLRNLGNVHTVQPRVVSISQATELGTVYTLEELRDLSGAVHSAGLFLHMDGAHLPNAAAALGVTLRQLVHGVQVDLLSLGVSRHGGMLGEATVATRQTVSYDLPYLEKQTLQLAPKQRFLAAQFDALMKDDLWITNAANANAMATALAARVEQIENVTVLAAPQTNVVRARLRPEVVEVLRRRWAFTIIDELGGEVRWVCSWDTKPEDVKRFVAAIADVESTTPHVDPALLAAAFAPPPPVAAPIAPEPVPVEPDPGSE